MKYSKKIWLSGFWCVLGAVLIVFSFAGVGVHFEFLLDVRQGGKETIICSCKR